MPLPLVVAVALLGVAPAGLSVAVTTTPLWLTGLPLPSCSWSTGCWANATPLCAALEGAVVKASRPAAPAVPSADRKTARLNFTHPPTAAAGVCLPAVVLRVSLPRALPTFFFLMIRRPPRSTPFPYPPLFRPRRHDPPALADGIPVAILEPEHRLLGQRPPPLRGARGCRREGEPPRRPSRALG